MWSADEHSGASTGASSLLSRWRFTNVGSGYFAAECVTKVHGGFVDRKLLDRCPELNVVAVAPALVTVVPFGVHIH